MYVSFHTKARNKFQHHMYSEMYIKIHNLCMGVSKCEFLIMTLNTFKKIKCDFELVSQSHFASKFMTAVNFSSFNVTIL